MMRRIDLGRSSSPPSRAPPNGAAAADGASRETWCRARCRVAPRGLDPRSAHGAPAPLPMLPAIQGVLFAFLSGWGKRSARSGSDFGLPSHNHVGAHHPWPTGLLPDETD
eukprot:3630148-Prymnesium_polylepis.1